MQSVAWAPSFRAFARLSSAWPFNGQEADGSAIVGPMLRKPLGAAVAAGIIGLGAIVVSSSSCTFLVKRDAAQCSNDGDCTSRGPAFEGTFCSDRGVCQSSLTYCFSNQQCMDRNKGAPYVCQKDNGHVCAPILTAECPRIIGDPADLKNDDAVVIGAIMMPGWNPVLKGAEDSIELALNDLKTTAGGIKGTTGKGVPRPILVNACEIPLSNFAANQPASDHLFNEVRVPTIIGPLPSDWLQYSFSKALAANPKSTVMTPSGVAGQEFTNAPGRVGVLFRTGYTGLAIPATVGKIVPTYMEPALRAQKNIPAATPIKFAAIKSGDGTEDAVIAATYAQLSFNGKTAPQNGGNYREFNYGDPAAPDFDTKLASVLADVQNFAPDIVSLWGASEVPTVFLQIEKTGIAPYYIVGTGALSSQISDYVGTDENIRKRIWIHQPGRGANDPNIARFYQRFQAAYPEDTASELAALVFDTSYMAFYAMATAGDKPVTGEVIGQGLLNKLKAGPQINVGPTDMLNALGALEQGQTISFNGLEVTGNFDANGDLEMSIEILCVDNTNTEGALAGFKESGLVYHDGIGFVGTNGCFPSP